MEIKKGEIFVCISEQRTGCGILYIKEGSIVCAAEDVDNYNWLDVYRNKSEQEDERELSIKVDKLRRATPEEILLWENNVFFVESKKSEAHV